MTKFLYFFLTTDMAKALLILILEDLVLRTDNTLDDKILAEIKKRLVIKEAV